MLLSQYHGGLAEAQNWLDAPVLVIIRLAGCIKRRHSTKGDQRRMPVEPSQGLLDQAEEFLKKMKAETEAESK